MAENATTVRVELGFVHPLDLEVSWETTHAGEVCYWVQVADPSSVEVQVEERFAADFQAGLHMAHLLVADHAVADHAAKRSYRGIPVARVNVTSPAERSFVATVLEPAAEL